jgi:uncharacterized cofD-like protein
MVENTFEDKSSSFAGKDSGLKEIEKPLNVVAIGGGTGLAMLLSGLKEFVAPLRVRNGGSPKLTKDGLPQIATLSAIVAVTDDGGSSGRLRDEFGVLPPGDVRNCILALGEDSSLLSKLFRYRFPGEGDLGGHSFGNLFLTALTALTGDFAESIRLSCEILATKGHIYPATLSDVRLTARLKDGTIVEGESAIGKIGPSVDTLSLLPPDCRPIPEALEAINKADIITVGPGSLFTSLLPPLLVSEIAEAVAASKALKMFICNLMTQPGETDGYRASDHVRAVVDHVGPVVSAAVVNTQMPRNELLLARYRAEGALPVEPDLDRIRFMGVQPFGFPLISEAELVRHDPARLAEAVLEVLDRLAGVRHRVGRVSVINP